MTATAFLSSLAQELRRRGVPHDRLALETFARGVWPQALRDPDPDRWAGAFTAWQREGVRGG
jgi:hypothetical protein